MPGYVVRFLCGPLTIPARVSETENGTLLFAEPRTAYTVFPSEATAWGAAVNAGRRGLHHEFDVVSVEVHEQQAERLTPRGKRSA
jgi:hypothetical protein